MRWTRWICSFATVVALAAVPSIADATVVATLRNNANVTSEINPSGEQEAFRVEIPAGAKVVVIVKGKKEKQGRAAPAMTVELRNSADVVVATGVVKGVGSKIKGFVPTVSDTYEVRVTSANAGLYQLKLKWKAQKKFAAPLSIDTAPTPFPFAAENGSVAKVAVKTGKRETAVVQVDSLRGTDAPTALFPAPNGGKLADIPITFTEDYEFLVTASQGAAVKVTVKIKPPKVRKSKTTLVDAVIKAGDANAPEFLHASIADAGQSQHFTPLNLDPPLERLFIRVPSNTFSRPTALAFGSTTDIAGPGVPTETLGPAVFVGPVDLTLTTPISIELPIDIAAVGGDTSRIVVTRRASDGSVERLTVPPTAFDVIANTVSIDTTLFGTFQAAAAPPHERAIVITNPRGPGNPGFGEYTTTDGNRVAVVGTDPTASNELDKRSVYVYEPDGNGGFTLLDRVDAPSAEAFNSFGFEAVAFDDRGRLIVGDPFAPNTDSVARGRVYVFEESLGTYTLIQTIERAELAAFDLFGGSLSASVNTLVIGADDTGTREGMAFVYAYNANTGLYDELQTLDPSDFGPVPANDDLAFGRRVALSGSRIAIGAPLHDNGFPASGNRGAVYTYVFNNGWQPDEVIFPDSGEQFGLFGNRIALRGSLLVVQAEGHDAGTTVNAGVLQTFERGPTNWTYLETIVSTKARANTGFRTRFDMDNGTLVVGRPIEDYALNGDASGRATCYTFANGRFTRVRDFDFAGHDVAGFGRGGEFGSSIAIRDGLISVTARQLESGTPPQTTGGAFFFELP